MRAGNMPKIKIFKIDEKVDMEEGDYGPTIGYSYNVITAGVSDWEEVTEEDLILIRSNKRLIEKEIGPCIIIEEPEKKAVDFVKSIKDFITKQIEKEKEAIKQREKIERERKKKRAETKKARELKKLQELKAKYG